ncbi:MAG: mcpT, partial [Rhizobium sp.]|nr:mcpT [Rhizobium sp.]
DAGKGFAVVATEVRALAQKTAQASNEVRALIERSSKEVHQGAELVRKATEQFAHIVDSITSISAISNEIATDSTSQSENLTQLTAAMRSLDQLISDNKRLVGNLTQSSDRTSREMQTLREIVSLFQLPVDADRSFRRVA